MNLNLATYARKQKMVLHMNANRDKVHKDSIKILYKIEEDNMNSGKIEETLEEMNQFQKKIINDLVDEDMNTKLTNTEYIENPKFHKTVEKLKKERNFENGNNKTLQKTIVRIENSQKTISELIEYCEKMKKSYEYILNNILYCDSLDDKFDGELYADCIPYSQVMLNRENNKISKFSKKINEEYEETDEMIDAWHKEHNASYFGQALNDDQINQFSYNVQFLRN